MERDILVEVNHPFIVKLHYGKCDEFSYLLRYVSIVQEPLVIICCLSHLYIHSSVHQTNCSPGKELLPVLYESVSTTVIGDNSSCVEGSLIPTILYTCGCQR